MFAGEVKWFEGKRGKQEEENRHKCNCVSHQGWNEVRKKWHCQQNSRRGAYLALCDLWTPTWLPTRKPWPPISTLGDQ